MFDRTDDYEEKIKPILKELNRMCVICGIPYFAAFCVKDMDGKTSYRNVLYSASNMSTVLSDDQLCKHINVANGFDTVLHQPELDFSVSVCNANLPWFLFFRLPVTLQGRGGKKFRFPDRA